jgi:hypothetical protein
MAKLEHGAFDQRVAPLPRYRASRMVHCDVRWTRI